RDRAAGGLRQQHMPVAPHEMIESAEAAAEHVEVAVGEDASAVAVRAVVGANVREHSTGARLRALRVCVTALQPSDPPGQQLIVVVDDLKAQVGISVLPAG